MVPRRDPPPARDHDRASLALLCVALALGAALRLRGLGTLSFSYDELFAARFQGLGARSLAGVLASCAFDDQHPPLYYLLALAWTSLAGASELALRLPSALVGVASLAAVHAIGAALRSRRVGATAALLLAVLPFHVVWSREARMYALLASLALVATLLLLRLARTGSGTAAWLASACALALTHYFGAFFVFTQGVLLLLRGRRALASLPQALACFAVPAAAVVPFALFARYQAAHFDQSYLAFDLEAFLDTGHWLAGSHPCVPPAWTVALPLAAAAGPFLPRRTPDPRGVLRDLPPAPGPLERSVLVALAAGALLSAAALWDRAAPLAAAVRAFRIESGETPALALEQGRLAVVAARLGALGLLVASLACALRDRIPRPRVPSVAAAAARDPLASLQALGWTCVVAPFALATLAGVCGQPLVLARNFITAAPFVALLAADGLERLAPRVRGPAVAVLLLGALVIDAQLGAVPWIPAGDGPVARWIARAHPAWRGLRAALPPGDRSTLVVAQHFSTDGVFYYLAHRDVARVTRDAASGALRVGQSADGDPSATSPWRPGVPFSGARAPAFFFLEARDEILVEDGLGPALAAAVRAEYACRRLARLGRDGELHRCVPLELQGLRGSQGDQNRSTPQRPDGDP